jgi:hypothetical protein
VIAILMELGAWLRFATQNVALLHQTATVVRSRNAEAASLAAAWLFFASSVFGLAYATYKHAPPVYGASNAVSVLCQGLVLLRLHRRRPA